MEENIVRIPHRPCFRPLTAVLRLVTESVVLEVKSNHQHLSIKQEYVVTYFHHFHLHLRARRAIELRILRTR